jgi:paraquat-inducible protein B
LPNNPDHLVPVLIRLDPSIITDIPPGNTRAAEQFVSKAVQNGLRASLKTGSLLTGQLFIDLDFRDKAESAKIAQIDGYRILPTVSGGLSELTDKATAVLDKIAALPLQDTLENLSGALEQLKQTAASLETTAGSYGKESPLYQNLSQTLDELDQTLRSLRTLTNTIERKPNSLIFGKPGNVPPPKGSDR